MFNLTISTNKNKALPKEVINLWVKVGWGKESDYNASKVRKALTNTTYVLSVCEKEQGLVGLARVFSDKVFHTSLAEVAVDPDFQNKGIGKVIMDRISKDFRGTGIYLESLPGKAKFFEKSGYTLRNKMKVFSQFSK